MKLDPPRQNYPGVAMHFEHDFKKREVLRLSTFTNNANALAGNQDRKEGVFDCACIERPRFIGGHGFTTSSLKTFLLVAVPP